MIFIFTEDKLSAYYDAGFGRRAEWHDALRGCARRAIHMPASP